MIGAERHLALMNEAVRRFEGQRRRLERPTVQLPVERFLTEFSDVAGEGVFADLDSELLHARPHAAASRLHP